MYTRLKVTFSDDTIVSAVERFTARRKAVLYNNKNNRELHVERNKSHPSISISKTESWAFHDPIPLSPLHATFSHLRAFAVNKSSHKLDR